ncbi:hypothetical protein QN277_022332 [Acacia crassicarpa]|uniref:PGG domain-containing protein n=1 Tax=Acacia crassicarpa TaxID=499986 RepID=A0AAE1MPH4_9FABA|nr:hypothetical protein QN277_022332 [Acacia crassicarpa]
MEIKIVDNNEEEERMRDLYDAALKGCVSTLNTLLQQDPLILHRVSSQTTFFETPLHKSSLLGHLEFTKTLLARCPKLGLELDSFRSTPLHLASAQGHIDIVKELLKSCGEACFFRDQEHKIPLHYAVIRGRRDVVLELIRAKPESLTFRDDKGKNILHLCVMYNHLEILKELEAFTHYDTNNLLTEGDSDVKNTILHLAIMLKQVETVRYLMSIPKIRSEALNLKNNMGYSARDIVAQIPKDSMSLEMQVILMEFGINCEKKEESWWQRKVFNRIDKWLVYNGEQLEQMRGNICTVASVISTISFQAALNPPGSVIQQNIKSSNNSSDPSFNTFPGGPFACLPWFSDVNRKNHTKGPCPGQAISSYMDPNAFKFFMLSNTISFLASLGIALLIVLGVPLHRRSVSCMVSQGMGLSMSCLISSYLLGVRLVSPIGHYQYKAIVITIFIVNGLHALIGIYVSVKLVMEKVKKKQNKQVKVYTSP